MNVRRLEAALVREAARGRWLWILRTLAPSLADAIDRGSKHGPCPIHGGSDGFRLYRDVAETGGAVCNSCGFFKTGVALLMAVNGWSYRQTLEALADLLGILPREPGRAPPPAPPVRVPVCQTSLEPKTKLLELCRHLWGEASPNAHHVLEYLRTRGAALCDLPDDVRGHPGLVFWHGTPRRALGTFPAMLAILRSSGGAPCGLHRTYLDPQGPQKAKILDPEDPQAPPLQVKKVLSFSPASGAAVHLTAAGERLALCEGIENGSALLAATGVRVWAAYSAGALARVELPELVHQVDVWADDDPAGRRAAEDAQRRFAAEGRKVRVIYPGRHIDRGAP